MLKSTIHDQLCILALVYTNDIERLNRLLSSQIIEIDLNFVYILPVAADASNIMHVINDLLLINGFFHDLNDFMAKNRLFQILSAHYRIKGLEPHPAIESMLSDSCLSSGPNINRQEETNQVSINAGSISESNDLENEYFEMTLLKVAVLMEYEEMVKFLIDSGAQVDPLNEKVNIHPIHLSLYQNNSKILSTLLNKLSNEFIERKSINTLIDKNGLNPLHLAVYNQSIEAIHMLYEYGGDINHATETVKYPLIWAMETFEIANQVIECLLKLNVDVNIADQFNNISPLILAIILDRYELVEMLLNCGADVNMKFDDSYTTPLRIAVDYYRENTNGETILKAILEAGANINFDLPEILQHPDKARIHRNSGTSVEDEEFDSIMSRVQLLTQNNGLNWNRSYRRYPLIFSIYNGSKDLVRILLEYGAYPHTIAFDYYSPMCTACHLGNKQVVDLLLTYNVDPTQNCYQSNTPLTIAIAKNDTNLVDTLIGFYKNTDTLNIQDNNGDFALLYAAYNQNTSVVKKLLKLGADPDLINNESTNALWYSVYNNDKLTFLELIKHVKDFEIKSAGIDYQNFETVPQIIYDCPLTPIAVAEINNYYTLIYYLHCAGATVSIELRRRIKVKLCSFLEAQVNANNSSLKKLRFLNRLLSQPMNLARICRKSIRSAKGFHLNYNNEIKSLPFSLKKFISLEII